MKLDGKNKNKNLSKIHDWHNRTRSAPYGGVEEGLILKKWGICNLGKGDQILMKFNI